MNEFDSILDRLLSAAARAPRKPVGPIPYALETQILSAWRRTLEKDDDATPALLFLFRAGLALACAVLLATLALNFSKFSGQGDDVDYGFTGATMDLVAMR